MSKIQLSSTAELQELVKERGLVSALNIVADKLDGVEAGFIKSLIEQTTCRLSEEDIEALTGLVLDNVILDIL